MNTHFEDRQQAGRLLGRRLGHYRNRQDATVLALPRGGVPVGVEVANALGAPLDLLIVRKLGLPGHDEFAIGAVASGGLRVLDTDVITRLGLARDAIEAVTHREFAELRRREQAYGATRSNQDVVGRIVILVDDGMATGSSMEAAVMAVRKQAPARIVVAVPVASVEAAMRFRRMADEVVTLLTPEEFSSVGQWYDCFDQLTDDDVRAAMAQFRRPFRRPEETAPGGRAD